MTPFEALVLFLVFFSLPFLLLGTGRKPLNLVCKKPGCYGEMEVVRPSSIVDSAVASGISRTQAVQEVALFYAQSGVKVIYECDKCGTMQGLRF